MTDVKITLNESVDVHEMFTSVDGAVHSGAREELAEDVELEYDYSLAANSEASGVAVHFVLHHAAEFGEYAVYATLYKMLSDAGAEKVSIAGEYVDVQKDAIRERLREVLEDE